MITCKKCVEMDPVFQECLDDIEDAWDNIGYCFSRIFCPSCGKPLEVTA